MSMDAPCHRSGGLGHPRGALSAAQRQPAADRDRIKPALCSSGQTYLNTGGNTYNITPAGGVTPEQLRATLTAYDAEQQRTVFARWQENKRRFG